MRHAVRDALDYGIGLALDSCSGGLFLLVGFCPWVPVSLGGFLAIFPYRIQKALFIFDFWHFTALFFWLARVGVSVSAWLSPQSPYSFRKVWVRPTTWEV